MNMKKLAIMFFVIAILIQVEQYITYGHWFDFAQIHHETFSVAFGFCGLVLFWYAKRRQK